MLRLRRSLFFAPFYSPLTFSKLGNLSPFGTLTIVYFFSRVNNFLTLFAKYFSFKGSDIFHLLFITYIRCFYPLSFLNIFFVLHPKPEHFLFIFFTFLIFAKHYFLSLDTNFLIFFLHCATPSAIRSIFTQC